MAAQAWWQPAARTHEGEWEAGPDGPPARVRTGDADRPGAERGDDGAGGDERASFAQRFPWLQPGVRRDASGRAERDELYDPSSVHIPESAISAMTPFEKQVRGPEPRRRVRAPRPFESRSQLGSASRPGQFWQLKRHAMDLILLVRCGSFYNILEPDTDAALAVGLNPTRSANGKGIKCGFSATKAAFRHWAERFIGARARPEKYGRRVEAKRRRRPLPVYGWADQRVAVPLDTARTMNEAKGYILGRVEEQVGNEQDGPVRCGAPVALPATDAVSSLGGR